MWSVITVFTSIIVMITINFLLKKPKKSISNKHVLITGGSSGIGKSFAILAAKEGAHVTVLARTIERLNEVLSDMQKVQVNEQQKLSIISCDVTNSREVEGAIKNAEISSGPIYMLVNCAGKAICGVLEDMSLKDTEDLVNLNLLGTIYPTRLCIPKMKKNKEGIIIFTASQGGLLGIYGYSVYASTKFAVRGLAEAVGMEVKPYNISVTLALPPDTDTPGFENENLSKPLATKLISESGGIYQPDDVAKQMLNDALKQKFYSYIGLESFMLSTLCAGMTPFNNAFELFIQPVLMGVMRVISYFVQMNFHSIVKKSISQESK